MKIALVDVDSKIPNLALMKISAYHKSLGDTVEFHDPLFGDKPDLIYASKVFAETQDYAYYPKSVEIIKGGSGYDLKNELPPEMERQYPDYQLYNCDYAIGFTTRGCIRKCPFCIVPKKEGSIRAVGDIYDFWRGQEYLMLLDNNLTAVPEHFEKILKQLIKHEIKTDFSQGLDIRLIEPEMAQLLSKVKLWKQIHFAWDDIRTEKAVLRGIDILTSNGVKPYKLMFYVLIGFNSTPEEDLYRVETLRGLGVDPFVMPYNKSDEYQRRFARWVNHKAIFKTVKWEDYVAHSKENTTEEGGASESLGLFQEELVVGKQKESEVEHDG